VAAGPPEEVAMHPESYTGRFLRPLVEETLPSFLQRKKTG
jgi:hypothetical protein